MWQRVSRACRRLGPAARGAGCVALLWAAPIAVPASLPGALTVASAADCAVTPGQQESGTPWAKLRLGYERAWAITRGQGVTVAVIDSGLTTAGHPQLTGMRVRAGANVLAGANASDTIDCNGHGTAVTGIIAAQPVAGVAFTGVAPEATIVPIKQSNTDEDGTVDGVTRGIRAAVAGGARIVNVSLGVLVDDPALRAAVAQAEAADVLIVAASSNRAQEGNPTSYPAAYPTVLAVGATAVDDSVASYSTSGPYLDLAAPGDNVAVPASLGGYLTVSGTSFAAPYVTGVAALVRSAHPELTAAQVRDRLTSTADSPGYAVPEPHYGYGIVNPYLAVTALGVDSPLPPATAAPTIAAPALPQDPDRSAQHRAIGIGAGLLGAALLGAVVAALCRPRVVR